MRILFIGDVVGRPGREAVCRLVPRLTDREHLDLVVANCENATDGVGVDPKSARQLLDAGVHVLTSGNHVWRRTQILEYIAEEPRLLRPANFPPDVPGAGWTLCETAGGISVAVVNLIGRVFMDSADCPFRTVDRLLDDLRERARVILVDMHAEATSEKCAMGWFLDGRVSAVLGTHTHVQTADDQILPRGTAYMTDVGMCGPTDSVIGVKKEVVLRRFLVNLPGKLNVASGPAVLHGALIEVEPDSGRARAIRRVREPVPT